MHKVVADPKAPPSGEPGPLGKIDEATIAPRPTRRYRAAAFQIYVFGAAAVFITLAVVAHMVAYFPIDLIITRAVQSYHGGAFDRLMYWVSWIGFLPQVIGLGAISVLALFLLGMRWESMSLLFAAAAFGIGTLVKLVVFRPRPSADLVHVFAQLPSSGFPSGHVLMSTAFCGFLVFLTYTLFKRSAWRTLAITLFSVFLGLMGLSRIYQGQHWFSDVMGAYLLGSLWLALTIKFYRWGKQRYFVHQPVAPASPTPASPATTPAPSGRAG